MNTNDQSFIYSGNFKPGVSGWSLTPGGALIVHGKSGTSYIADKTIADAPTQPMNIKPLAL